MPLTPEFLEAQALNSALIEKIIGLNELLAYEILGGMLTSEEKMFCKVLKELESWHNNAERFMKNYKREK